MKFAIVLRNHNALNLTAECLNSIQSIDYDNKITIVINDGCTDDSPTKLKELFPTITFIDSAKYLEYCTSLNLGIRKAISLGSDAVFIVNNDTKNFSTEYLTSAKKNFEKDCKIGLIGSKVKDYDGKWLWDGNYKDKLGVPMNTPTEGYIIKTEVFLKIGLLSERYYRYFEDLDFLIRLRNAGYKTYSDTSIQFSHLCNGTSSKQVFIPNYYRMRNFFWFIKKECKNQSFKWKIVKFHHAFKYHISRANGWIEKGKVLNFIGVYFSTVLGITVGTFTSFNHEDPNTYKLNEK